MKKNKKPTTQSGPDINKMVITIIYSSTIAATAIILATAHFYYFHFLETGNDLKNLGLTLIITVSFLFLGSAILSLFRRNEDRTSRIIISLISTVLAVMSMILGIQYMFTYAHVHFSNLSNESLFTLIDTSLRTIEPNILFGGSIIFAIIFIALFSLSRFKPTQKVNFTEDKKILLNLLLIATFIVAIFKLTELNAFFAFRYGDNQIIKEYERLYAQEIEKRMQQEYEIESVSDSNIFIIQLESLTGRTVNENVTPVLYELSSDGTLIKNLQATSVNTARILETILCDIPPAINEKFLEDPEQLQKIKCLPELLKEQGYKTIYLKHHNADDDNYKQFIKEVGFDEIHNTGLFKETDKQLTWGPEDGIAYRRFFEYLETEKNEKLFVYISLGAINHYPFKDHDKVDMEPTVDVSKEDVERKDHLLTTNLQDMAFGQAYFEYFEPMFASNSHLFVYGDHTWPVGIHPYNIYNWANAYQENFVTSLLFLPAEKEKGNFRTDNITEAYYGSRDIPKTILRLAGYKVKDPHLYNEISGENEVPKTDRCLVSIQPYTDKKIALTKYPSKYIIDVYGVSVEKYDLETDPDETRMAEIEPEFSKDPQTLMKVCLGSD